MRGMLEKARLVAALDKFDSFGDGVRQYEFFRWIHTQDNWRDCSTGSISKLLEDCVDDEWIGRRDVQEIDTDASAAHNAFMISTQEIANLRTKLVKYVYVRSRGREMLKWKFFIPAVLEKMSLMQLTYFAITTAILLGLGYLGIHGVQVAGL